jgi:site-specific recombinase XerC
MLRLLVRIPLRSRNLREMQLDRNLQRVDGTWQLTFKGDELKISWRNGRPHQVTYAFPADLTDLLNEWLTIWRPLLLRDAPHKEVFLNREGQPYSAGNLRKAILKTTYKFEGVAVNPHTIRDIWATEYIKATRDFAGAAYMLGNTVEIVLKHYAHLLDADAEERAISWLQSRLA